MTITITSASCSWGVDDVTNPHLPPWPRVRDEAAAAGYGGLELGPYGYMPLDLAVMSEALTRRGLFIVAGTIFDDLVSPANRDSVLGQPTRSAPSSHACRARRSIEASATRRPISR